MNKDKSSLIKDITWANNTLGVKFHSTKDKVYEYEDVPLADYNKLCSAKSIGAHFCSHIKPKFNLKKSKKD